ncbi:uncharacterized protein LOC118189215 [Stegodyphus dumicola]|uniref:uncharacterized protein LOC118189215 n=1 Tax=Stegodyphus dumicola TaxID=202533 RepID=UPI0015ACD2C5|nr:uncharacterized protein LOC118189215 [Stegodyphus dumicola]
MPLASTLENFIALVEKLEAANPNIGLKQELFYLLRSYFHENVEYKKGAGASQWEPPDSNFDKIEILWERNDEERQKKPERLVEPYSEDEKCSLFFMISHSVERYNRFNARFFSPGNGSEIPRNVAEHDELYPQEQGVVAIRGSKEAVALGRVLRAMYVGLKSESERKFFLDDYLNLANIAAEDLPDREKRTVDPLYILTISEVIAFSNWETDERSRGYAGDGFWKAAPVGELINIEDYCPMIYRLRNGTNAAYTFSTLRGAADGLLLGSVIHSILGSKEDAKLSQILRMYYTRGGILAETEHQVLGSVRASFCNRDYFISELSQEIKDQTYIFVILASKAVTTAKEKFYRALIQYNNVKDSVFKHRRDFQDYCAPDAVKEKLETPLDVIVVLDTRNGEENFQKQQRIVGYLSKNLDLSYYGSRLTILKDEVSSSAGIVELEPVLTDSYSSACAACHITQINYGRPNSAAPDEVIFAIDQLLVAKKENETNSEGVKGKVVIYFNFDANENSARPSASETKLKKALADLHLRHLDVAFFALGIEESVLKKFAKFDKNFYMIADTTEEHQREFVKKVNSIPAILKYEDCIERRSERSAIYEDFVSPSATQHWKMPAKYFYKSTSLKIVFESLDGSIQVCYNRATLAPEDEIRSCQNITNGQKTVEFKSTNPCQSFTDVTCAPFFFSLKGINASDPTTSKYFCSDRNTGAKCRTLDQIKFKISHDGIRCSGCYALVAKPLSVLFGFLIAYILIKKF